MIPIGEFHANEPEPEVNDLDRAIRSLMASVLDEIDESGSGILYAISRRSYVPVAMEIALKRMVLH